MSTHPLKDSLNVTEKDKYSETTDKTTSSSSSSTSISPQLFLMLRGIGYQYCFYRICEPENSIPESIILNLGEPFLVFDRSMYPDNTSFVTLGTSIYMVGGFCLSSLSAPHRLPSDQMFICDTLSKAIVPGPNLVSAQASPVLLTLGSKIYALTWIFFPPGTRASYSIGEPAFQVLDTRNLQAGWSLLHPPKFCFRQFMPCNVVAYAAVPSGVGVTSSAIFITLSGILGTYAFDLESEVWDKVSQVDLPFSDYAVPIDLPCAPSLYCALSSNNFGLISAFRFWYNADYCKLQVDEIKISYWSPQLPPERLYYVWPFIAVAPFGRVYAIQLGSDHVNPMDNPASNSYVKVFAAQVCPVKPNNMGKHTRNNQVEDGGELRMSKLWSNSFFAGRMGVCLEISTAAFALY